MYCVYSEIITPIHLVNIVSKDTIQRNRRKKGNHFLLVMGLLGFTLLTSLIHNSVCVCSLLSHV